MEKKIIKIYNGIEVEETTKYLKLSSNELAFLNWLSKHGYLDEETTFHTIDNLPKLIEF